MTRRLSHFLILGLLCSLPILPASSAAPPPIAFSTLLGEGPPTASAAEQIQPPAAPLPTVPALPTSAPLRPADAPRLPTARFVPQWLAAFRPTVLWASERTDAASRGEMPQWTPFRQLGDRVDSRLPVEYPGDGSTRLPLRGWVETADVGPAGPPNPELELASGGNLSPTSGVAVPRRTVQAWPQAISAQFAVLVDGDSGEILWGRNAHGEVAPASLTKIVTCLVALDRARLTDRVAVQVDSSSMWESTLMGLEPGENLSMETLLFGLMLPSGNDAALAIAQHVAGSESAFVNLMNAKAAELNLANSHFVNAHGLDAAGHYSSPFDLASFARVGMRNPAFVRLAGTRHWDGEGYSLDNLNRLLAAYPKADGVKVGFTDNAGRAIVASATQDGHRLYAVLVRSGNPVPEAQALLEWAFNGFSWT